MVRHGSRWGAWSQCKHKHAHEARSLCSAWASIAAMDRNLCLSICCYSTKNRHPLALPDQQQLQNPIAARADHRGLLPWWCGPGQSDPEHKLYEQDQTFGIAVQQAKVSDTPESFGQDMQELAPEELCAREGLDHLLACVVFDPKGDDSLAVAKNILFRDHPAIKVGD
jgi:hypothetical protein